MIKSRRRRLFTDIVGADSGEGQEPTEEELELESEEDEEEETEEETPEEQIERLTQELADSQKGRRVGDRERKKLIRELNKAKDDLAKATEGKEESAELADLRTENERLKAELEDRSSKDEVSLIRDAFIDLEGYSWQNRGLAFNLLGLDDIDVENGKVDKESLADAVKELAAEHPYLLKTATKSDDEDEDEKDKAPRTASGSPTGRKPNPSKKKSRESDLRQKYRISGRI